MPPDLTKEAEETRQACKDYKFSTIGNCHDDCTKSKVCTVLQKKVDGRIPSDWTDEDIKTIAREE